MEVLLLFLTTIKFFEVDGSCSYIVNGKDELFKQVKEFLENYYDDISDDEENFSLRLQQQKDGNCLLLKVTKVENH